MKKIIAWFKAHLQEMREQCRAEQEAEDFMSGYLWAMNAMADNELTVQEVLDRCDPQFAGPGSFSRGASRAAYVFDTK